MNRIKDDVRNLFRSVKILYTASPKYFIAKLIVTGISAVMPFAPLYLWRGLLNALTEYTTNAAGEILATIITFTILYCLIQVLQSVMSSIGKVVSYKYNDEVSYYLDNVLIDKMSHIDLAYFDSNELKNKMAYISQRMQPSALGLIMYQLSIIEQIIWLVFAFAIVSQLNVILILIIIALTVLSFLGEKFLKKNGSRFQKG